MRTLRDVYMTGSDDATFAIDFVELHGEDLSRLDEGAWLVSSECWRQTVLYLLNDVEAMEGKSDMAQNELAESNALRHLWDCARDKFGGFCGWPHCALSRRT